METKMDCKEDRISPLRNGLSQADILNQTRVVKNGLSSLREDHYSILTRIRDDYENERNANDANKENEEDNSPLHKVNRKLSRGLLEDRINNVTRSLERLEVGIEESTVMLGLAEHFERLEADRSTLRLEMGRVQDENDWLREELADTQRKLRETLLELTDLQEEKKKWDFEEELKNVTESSVRPVTPSKIPVGSWRVEEEKEINRALNGDGAKHRSASPAPSRIPVGGWRNKLSVYKTVMDKEKERKEKMTTSTGGTRGKGTYFKLNASKSMSKIPSR